MSDISQERLRELAHYNPETGIFTSLHARGRWPAGRTMGTINKVLGYVMLYLDGKSYYAHRMAWLYMTGDVPSLDTIDHRDLNKANNRWGNLREATEAQNRANMPATGRARSGLKGAHWDAERNLWVAQIRHQGKNHFLGRFADPNDAHAAYGAATKKLNGEFAREN